MTERLLIEAARRGDEAAFRALVAPLRGPLHAHCLRMLGSAHDAEDAMQDVMLRAWRALPTFEGRSSLRSWLYRIATNTCLTALDEAPRAVLPLDYELGDDVQEQQPLDARAEPDRSRLRAAGGRRARVDGHAPAAPGQAAGGADPPRRARVSGQRGRLDARDHASRR